MIHIFATSTGGEVLQFLSFTAAVSTLRMDHTDADIAENWVIEEFISSIPGSGTTAHNFWTPAIEGNHLVWNHTPAATLTLETA